MTEDTTPTTAEERLERLIQRGMVLRENSFAVGVSIIGAERDAAAQARAEGFAAGMEPLLALASAVETLAFEMPAPNSFTPRFVQLAVEARAAAIRARAAEKEPEHV